MAAIFPVYYVVRPKQALLLFLDGHPDARLARAPMVLVQDEPFPEDHDYPGQTADFETFAKLCYLGLVEEQRLCWSNERSSMTTEAAALSALLGSTRMTIDTFDQWWTLERIGLRFTNLDRWLEDAPVEAMKRVDGPHERSALAEESAREHHRVNEERRRAEIDEVTGLPPAATQPEISEWPVPVGRWWESAIAHRSRSETKG